MFQEELFNSQKYNSSKHWEEGATKIYRVTHHGRETPFDEVTLEFLEKKATCTCNMFEFVRILCMHILHVFFEEIFGGYSPTLCFREMDNQCQESHYT